MFYLKNYTNNSNCSYYYMITYISYPMKGSTMTMYNYIIGGR